MRRVSGLSSHIKKPTGKINIKSLSGSAVISRWDSHFKDAILDAFEGAKFVEHSEVKTAEGVANNVRKSLEFYGEDKHLVAVQDGRVVGALFNIEPPRKHKEVNSTSCNWVFTSPSLPKEIRKETGKRLAQRFHANAKKGGYDLMRITIGTRAGERFFWGLGYRRDPKNPQVWVKKVNK